MQIQQTPTSRLSFPVTQHHAGKAGERVTRRSVLMLEGAPVYELDGLAWGEETPNREKCSPSAAMASRRADAELAAAR